MKVDVTQEDLQNGCFAVFCKNGNRAVNFFGLKDALMKGKTVFQVSCLNSQSCKNNHPNCFFSRTIVQRTNASRDRIPTNLLPRLRVISWPQKE